MSSHLKARKTLGITAAATEADVENAVDRLKRAWQPLLQHQDPSRRALGAHKLAEIDQARHVLKSTSMPNSASDWNEKMVITCRLPDGSYGDRIAYLYDLHHGIARGADAVHGKAIGGKSAFAVPTRNSERGRGALRLLLRALHFLSYAMPLAYGVGVIFLMMLADHRHQAALHEQIAQIEAHRAAEVADVPINLLGPPSGRFAASPVDVAK